MKRFLTILAATLAITADAARADIAPVETPSLAASVKNGTLPPVARRIPSVPAIARFDGDSMAIGRPGGSLRILGGRTKDTRLMVVYGYARLVAYDRNFVVRPDILESVSVEQGHVFTLKLRKGHRWSDGHPFTSEDFRYYWEDVANNKMLSPIGVPRVLMVEGEPPRVDIVDETTVRYSWSRPNPYFLPALAGTVPLFIYRPAHYLRQFHARYADPKRLAKLVKKARRRNWAALHNRKDNQYANDNPALPVLQPWVLATKPPAHRFVFRRNPYYHRIDTAGHQLPYIDRVLMTVADPKIIPLKTGAGDSDLQARGLNFSNYAFLKQSEKRNGFQVHLWRSAKGSHMVLFPNLNINDPVLRRLFRDARFRRALSLAVNRHEINQVVYFGLAIEGNNTVLPKSPLFTKDYQTRWARFDLKEANRLLDEIGLTKRDGDVRLLPDGRPLNLIVETAGESTEQTDVLALIHDSWLRAGIKLYTRPSQREVFRNRIFAGETMISVWSGYENGLPTPDSSPDEFAPTSQQQLQWPKWGQYYESKGRMGRAPDMKLVEELAELNRQWRDAIDPGEKARIWHRILEIHADQVYTIGLVAGVPQPVVSSKRLRNLPAEGIFNWEPGAQFGVYRPEGFWFAPAADQARR